MDQQEINTLPSRITSNPGIFNGKPIIRGMRFKVSVVLEYLASRMTEQELLEDYPYLEKEDITACLLYAAKRLNHTILSVKLDAA
ncbi:hypothetical protein BH10BAC2_BH10BAC2_09830 [soil metagenome]